MNFLSGKFAPLWKIPPSLTRRRAPQRTKKTLKVDRRHLCNLVQLKATKLSETPPNFDDVSRFVSFAAMRNRSEEGTIGFDQQPVERHLFRDCAQLFRLAKGHDA